MFKFNKITFAALLITSFLSAPLVAMNSYSTINLGASCNNAKQANLVAVPFVRRTNQQNVNVRNAYNGPPITKGMCEPEFYDAPNGEFIIHPVTKSEANLTREEYAHFASYSPELWFRWIVHHSHTPGRDFRHALFFQANFHQFSAYRIALKKHSDYIPQVLALKNLEATNTDFSQISGFSEKDGYFKYFKACQEEAAKGLICDHGDVPRSIIFDMAPPVKPIAETQKPNPTIPQVNAVANDEHKPNIRLCPDLADDKHPETIRLDPKPSDPVSNTTGPEISVKIYDGETKGPQQQPAVVVVQAAKNVGTEKGAGVGVVATDKDKLKSVENDKKPVVLTAKPTAAQATKELQKTFREKSTHVAEATYEIVVPMQEKIREFCKTAKPVFNSIALALNKELDRQSNQQSFRSLNKGFDGLQSVNSDQQRFTPYGLNDPLATGQDPLFAPTRQYNTNTNNQFSTNYQYAPQNVYQPAKQVFDANFFGKQPVKQVLSNIQKEKVCFEEPPMKCSCVQQAEQPIIIDDGYESADVVDVTFNEPPTKVAVSYETDAKSLGLEGFDLTTTGGCHDALQALRNTDSLTLNSSMAKSDELIRLACATNAAVINLADLFSQAQDFDTTKFLWLCSRDFTFNLFKAVFQKSTHPWETFQMAGSGMVSLAAMIGQVNLEAEHTFDFFDHRQNEAYIQKMLVRAHASHEAHEKFMHTPVVQLSGEAGTFMGSMVGDLLNFKAIGLVGKGLSGQFSVGIDIFEEALAAERSAAAAKNVPAFVAGQLDQLPALTKVVAQEGVEATTRAVEVLAKNPELLEGGVPISQVVQEVAKDAKIGRGNQFVGQTKEQLLKSKASYESLIQEHEAKLADYIASPDKCDHLGMLKNISSEIRQKRIQGRITELERQIRRQKDDWDIINRLINPKE